MARPCALCPPRLEQPVLFGLHRRDGRADFIRQFSSLTGDNSGTCLCGAAVLYRFDIAVCPLHLRPNQLGHALRRLFLVRVIPDESSQSEQIALH